MLNIYRGDQKLLINVSQVAAFTSKFFKSEEMINKRDIFTCAEIMSLVKYKR